MAKVLQGKIALLAGATRGAGRGIAIALGEAGATVYCTGRSSRNLTRGQRPTPGRPETIEETAELVTAAGGRRIAVRVDHTEPAQVKKLVARIKRQHKGLDILVNDVWGGDALTEFGKTFWTVNLENGLAMLKQAIHSHIITSHYAVPLMLGRGQGIIFEITDGDAFYYRGNIFYDLVKISVIRLAFAMARELRKQDVASVALPPVSCVPKECWSISGSAKPPGRMRGRTGRTRTARTRTTRPPISWSQNRRGISAAQRSRWRPIRR